MPVLLLLAPVAIGLVFVSWRRTKYWKLRGIAGPTPRLFVGNLWQLGKSRVKSWPFTYREWSQKYGSYYGIQRGWRNALIVSDPEMAKEIMNEKFEYFGERDSPPIESSPLPHVFASHGLQWTRLRALTEPATSVNSIKKVLPTIKSSAIETCYLLEQRANDGNEFDVKNYLEEFAMDVTCKVGLGLNDHRQFGTNLTRLVRSSLDDVENGFAALSWMAPFLGRFLNIAHLGSTVLCKWEFVQMILSLRRKINEQKDLRTSGGTYSTKESTNFVEMLLDSELDEKQLLNIGNCPHANRSQIAKKLSTEELFAHCLLLLFTWFDSTSTTLAFTTYYLAKHPEIQQKMRQELEEHCPNSDPTFEDLNKLKYSKAVMQEVLRFHPIDAVATSRRCTADTTIGSLQIEKGTDVVVDTLSIHFDRKLWGNDADEFNPDRWLSSESTPHYFYAFGAGKRTCLGTRLAYLEQLIFLAHLLRKYRIVETPNTKLDISGFIMHPKEIRIRLEHLEQKL